MNNASIIIAAVSVVLILLVFLLNIAVKASSKRDTGKLIISILGIVLCFITLSDLIVVPHFIGYRNDTRTGLCNGNRRLISHAKGVYGIKNNKKDGDEVTQNDLVPLINGGFPICPDGGRYSINPIGVTPTCSFHKD